MKNYILFFLTLTGLSVAGSAQNDYMRLKSALLADTPIEEDLDELCNDIGGRITGSAANKRAIEWAYSKFYEMGVNVWKDPFEMPVLWLPDGTTARIYGKEESFPPIVSKYGTKRGVYNSKLISVGKGSEKEFAEKAELIGKRFIIVETEMCLDINGLFQEYAHAAHVEELAYKYNAQGIIFMSSRPKGLLYRFVTSRMTEDIIPQFVMARENAQEIMDLLEEGIHVEIGITVNNRTGSSFQSHNVIAEIPGQKYPDEVVIIGAHLDSWELGTGANDNGCNVVLMMDIARQMKALNIRPDRTIRFALWNGEEQGYFGSWNYTLDHLEKLDDHVMAMSVDIGSGAIIGFFTNGRDDLTAITDSLLNEKASELGPFLQINAPIVGTDNFDFMLQGVPNLVGNHKPYNYGLNYHASSDTYDKVDFESLKKNAAIVAALTLAFANLSEYDRKKLPRLSRPGIQEIFDAHNLEFTMRMFNVWESWINKARGIK